MSKPSPALCEPVWLDKEVPWLAPRDGRPAVFSDAAIQFCLSIKVLFKFPLRQTAEIEVSSASHA